MDINSRKSSTWIVLGVALLFSVILIFQFMQNPDEEFARVLNEHRKAANEFFLNGEGSPLPDSVKGKFKGLAFFAPDRSWQAQATLKRTEGEKQVVLPESSGSEKVYYLAGSLEFELKGKACKLTAYFLNGNNGQNLFIPFRDGTSGTSTYGGGRYLEAKLIQDKAFLDFNRAYHPYCVYNYAYACPIPPAENKLEIAVEAGEKLPEGYTY